MKTFVVLVGLGDAAAVLLAHQPATRLVLPTISLLALGWKTRQAYRAQQARSGDGAGDGAGQRQ